MTAGSAVQKLMMQLPKEQEILMAISDMMIETYVSESLLLRTQKLVDLKGEENCQVEIAIMKSYIYDACDKINKSGKDILNSFAEGDELRMMLMGLKRFTKHEPFNVKLNKRIVADNAIKNN